MRLRLKFCRFCSSVNNPNPIMQSERVVLGEQAIVSKKGGILLANSNQLYFNNLVKSLCHKTSYRCPHRLNLTSQCSRSCAHLNIKTLKDKALEFANSIREGFKTRRKVILSFGEPYHVHMGDSCVRFYLMVRSQNTKYQLALAFVRQFAYTYSSSCASGG